MVHRPTRLIVAALALLVVSRAGAESLFLPRGKAETRRNVSGCESLGTGFHKVEGSQTCVRIGGSVRLEQSFTTGGGGSPARR